MPFHFNKNGLTDNYTVSGILNEKEFK